MINTYQITHSSLSFLHTHTNAHPYRETTTHTHSFDVSVVDNGMEKVLIMVHIKGTIPSFAWWNLDMVLKNLRMGKVSGTRSALLFCSLSQVNDCNHAPHHIPGICHPNYNVPEYLYGYVQYDRSAYLVSLKRHILF